MSIELACMRWLRFEKKCMFVLNERTPQWGVGLPDVLGVTRAREVTEIEVKRSMSDFRANAKKYCIINREHFLERWPKQYYFAVPPKMKDKVLAELPEWAGLLVVEHFNVTAAKVAPINKSARKLTVKQCCRLAECMANQIAAQATMLVGIEHRERVCPCYADEIYHGSSWNPDYTNYQI